MNHQPRTNTGERLQARRADNTKMGWAWRYEPLITQEEAARLMGINRETAGQLERSALAKIQAAIEASPELARFARGRVAKR